MGRQPNALIRFSSTPLLPLQDQLQRLILEAEGSLTDFLARHF